LAASTFAAFKSFFDIFDFNPGVATAAAADKVAGILELSFAAVGNGNGAGGCLSWGVTTSLAWVCCDRGDGFVGNVGGADCGSSDWKYGADAPSGK